MDAEKRAILRRVRVFADLADDECDAVLAVLKARRGAPGDTLFREGEAGDSLMIVLDGYLVASVRTDAGTSEVVARLGPGEVVGEMAFASAEPRSATVTTPEGATVLAFTRDALAQLRRTSPRVAAAIHRNVLADLSRRLRDAGAKLADASGGPTSRRAGPESVRRSARGLTVAALRAMPALGAYGDEDLELLAYIATLRSFTPGETLMVEGGEGEACFLVVSGAVSVTRSAVSEPLATLGPGALVGQLALLDRAPRSATVTAMRETMALELRADAFGNLVRATTPIALRFQEQVILAGVKQLRAATKKVASAVAREMAAPTSMRMLDDWDSGADDGSASGLELAVDPRAGEKRW